MRKYFVLYLLIVLSACQSENKEKVNVIPFEEMDLSVQQKMRLAVTPEYLSQLNLPDSVQNYLKKVYWPVKFKPRWINDSTLTKEGLKLKQLLNASFKIGIPKNVLISLSTQNYIQDEINLTLGLSQIISTLENGIIDYSTKQRKPINFISQNRFHQVSLKEYTDYRYYFLQHGPKDSTYQVLAKGLIDLVDHFPIDTSTFSVKSIRIDSTMAFIHAKAALLSKGYIKDPTIDSLSTIEALKQFQIDNGLKPDGVIGKYTSKALNESTRNKIDRIILAMDKLRDQKKRPDKYLYINIPEYKLRFYINDSLKREHNIVVGKFKNQTPELTSKLRKIVIYPYWNVPYSISSKEILPAVKRNVNYLAKHQYKLFKKGEEIDPLTVNWNRIRQNAFPFKVRQEPGPKNALGIIKFDFYNSHSVYFHDTPSKSLFGADVRAYSHGCMRTQDPVDLAKSILERDEFKGEFNVIIADSVDSILSRQKNYEIRLLDPIPIFIEYQTVTRFGGRMVLYVDVYGRDEEYLKILRE